MPEEKPQPLCLSSSRSFLQLPFYQKYNRLWKECQGKHYIQHNAAEPQPKKTEPQISQIFTECFLGVQFD
ncbi:MAG: hypothetical protein AAB344_08190, partial [Bacteroidota bacterium]